ncbi:MAG: hypothetical protein HXY46_09330 [Syntrophaceae bacterium]|nr:hypothetical protein [Syntrophaceae bacterium]
MKLPALTGGASRKRIIIWIVPLHPALPGGACGALAGQGKKVKDFVDSFKNLSMDERKEGMKKLIPEFCQIAMENKSFIQEMMPQCIGMMKGLASR